MYYGGDQNRGRDEGAGHMASRAAERECILVLDDDPILRLLLSRWLEPRGYAVHAYESPCDISGLHDDIGAAIANFRAIISDVTMPGMDGIRFMRMLADSNITLPPRALLSGGWTPEAMDEARQLGCHILHKPTSLRAISDWLAMAIAASPRPGVFQ